MAGWGRAGDEGQCRPRARVPPVALMLGRRGGGLAKERDRINRRRRGGRKVGGAGPGSVMEAKGGALCASEAHAAHGELNKMRHARFFGIILF